MDEVNPYILPPAATFLSEEGDGLVVLTVEAERLSHEQRKSDADEAKLIGDKPHAAVRDDCTPPAEMAFAALARDAGDGFRSPLADDSNAHASLLAENTGFSLGAVETAEAATVINAASRPVDDEHISADSAHSALVGTAATARIDLTASLAGTERLSGDTLLSAPIAAAAAPAASGEGRAARGVDGDAALAGGGNGGIGGYGGGGGKGELGLADLRASVVGLATSAEVRFVASLSGSIYDLWLPSNCFCFVLLFMNYFSK
jgi:hypothetical protein